MKTSLIALLTCCAVSSAAFAYQNNQNGGQTARPDGAGMGTSHFVMNDDPGINPPKVMDDPGINPPKVMDDPGINPPKVMDDPGINPPKVMDDPGINPPKVMDDPGIRRR